MGGRYNRETMPTALCVGAAHVEVLGVVPKFPVRMAVRQELSAFSLQGSGTAANVAVTLVRLGAQARFAGVLPEDFMGDFAASSLADAGVELSGLKRAGTIAPSALVLVDHDTRGRTELYSRGEVEEFTAADVPGTALTGIDLLAVDGFFAEAQLDLMREARKRKILTLLIAHEGGPHIKELLSNCDAVIVGEAFAGDLGAKVPSHLNVLFDYGPQCVVVTLGRDGCVGQERGGKPITVEPIRVPVVDRTGAGDVFRGAFAYAWMNKMPLYERLRFATAAAALKCQSYGSREGIPDVAAVEAALKQ